MQEGLKRLNFDLLENLSEIIEFKKALKNPKKVQQKLMLKIISRNANTVYGKKYSFKNIKSIEDFQKQVPIINYSDIISYINALKRGENNILTRDKVIYFATTSGTTKNVKLIPVTKDRARVLRMELLLWSFYFLNKNKSVLKGKMLYFAGPYHEFFTEANIACGSISGYLAHKTPWYLKQKLVIPPKVYNIMNFDEKTKKIAILALLSDITQIGFASPIEAILFFDYIKNNRENLIEELRKKRKYRRVKELVKLKDFTPIEIWPNLKLINCIKSTSNKNYLNALNKKIGKQIKIRDPGIYSSEGRISLCVEDSDDVSGIIPVTESFFEFIEQKDGRSINEPITIEKIELGKEYLVIITTREGLYRYDMGDVVRVVGFKEKLPMVQFVTRTNFLNIAGELVHEDILIESLNSAFKKSNVQVSNFTVIPKLNPAQKPRYEILIEPQVSFSNEKIKKLCVDIDKMLQENISDYRQMRNEFGRLDSPIITIIKKGSYDLFNKKRLIKGGQPKPIYMNMNPAFRENFEIELEYSSK